MSMRIIAGEARGRLILSVPKTMMVKPISGRMRQSVFDILRPIVTGCHFLDLFAGTGAVGLEALSRGAGQVVFVDKDPVCVKVVESNLERFKWTAKGKVFRGDVLGNLSWIPFRSGVSEFDIVFLGPPYRTDKNVPLAYSKPVLQGIDQAGFLSKEGMVICQHHKKEDIGSIEGLKRFRLETYGDTTISFLRRR